MRRSHSLAAGRRSRTLGVDALLALFGVATVLALLPRPAAAAIEVHAQLERGAIGPGETTALEVIVEGGGSVSDPRFEVPEGIEVLGTSRSQNFSWINGRSSTRLVFRYELAATAPGHYSIGPIQVLVSGQAYQSPAVSLVVSAEPARVPARGRGPASLLVDVSPSEPYVGQPVVLRVRLVQRASLAEDPRYTPPATPGFWAERSTPPESYYAGEAMTRVLVTETRSRLYPLAAGEAKIGEATAQLVLAQADRFDPLAWLNGMPARRAIEVRSTPATVRVRPLPPGAPAGFDGAVGRFGAHWQADRARTPQDVPFTVRLDLRGVGNLPLVRTPALAGPEAEVFASTVDDSLGALGSLDRGRRRFTWTVLAKRSGTLRLDAPPLSWFDPEAGTYREASLTPLVIEVGAPTVPSAAPASEFPIVFAEHPLDPFAVRARPWGLALAGLFVGLALRLAKPRRRRAADTASAPSVAPWMEGLRHARGASFWAAAGRALDALAERGEDTSEVRPAVDAARFGNASAPEDSVRAKLLSRLERRSAGDARRRRDLALAGVALVAALAIGIWSLPHRGPDTGVRSASEADRVARAGDVERAARVWRDLWRRGARDSGLAARLAWSEIRLGSVAEAAAWALRGDGGEARDPSLSWVVSQVREAGGLVGYAPARLPVRAWEWGAVAGVLALAGALADRRRGVLIGCLAAVLAVADDGQRVVGRIRPRAVVLSPVPLEGADLELSAGDVVRVVRHDRERVWVQAGRGVSGWVRAGAIASEQT